MNPNQASSSSVLIIDDDASVGKTLAAILRKAGHEVHWVASGQEALTYLRNGHLKNPLNVALIDVRLPDMNGVDVLREVKKMNSDYGAIMMTGDADMDTAVRSLNEGAFAYVQKPYHADEIKSLIEKVFDKQKLVLENKALIQRLKEWNTDLEKTVQEKTAELRSKNLMLLEVIEKMKVINEMKSRFVANASHELQTPMTSILGFSSMLLDYWERIDHKEITKFLQIIRDEAQRLTRLARDLLDLSRIQDGRVSLDYKEIDLKTVAERVRDNLSVVRPGVAIEIDFEEGARRVLADEDKIQQIFTNLLGNALKFSPEGGAVRIKGRERGRAVIIDVIDQGPGVPTDKREKIFEPFYRIHDDIGNKVRGTGLGLPIAKAIVEALGGAIRVEGEAGKGSTFTFVLPKEALKDGGKPQDTPQ